VRVLIESALAGLVESIQTVLPRFLAAVLVIFAFGLAAWVVKRLLNRLLPNLRGSETTKHLIVQLIFYALWVLGIVVAVSAMGFDPQALATAIGLTSVALGFAMGDILSNLVSGLLLLIMRPFRLGDQIIVGDTEGAVEGIELRATRIRTYDGRVVLVPNAEIFTSRLTNNTASPLRRGSVIVRLGYDTDLRRAAELMLDAASATQGVLDEPPPSILLSELEPTTVAVEVRFWTDSRRSDFLAARSRVNEAVVARLREAGIPLPDPAAVKIVTR
jgi:small-conductance mechanosensitive channel